MFSEAYGSYSTAFNVGETHGRYSFAIGSGSIAGWTEEEFNTKFPNGVNGEGYAWKDGDGDKFLYRDVLDEEGNIINKEFRAFSIAFGRESIAKGKASLASGYSSRAEGNNATAINGGKVYGDDSFAGAWAVVNGKRSFGFGAGNAINGDYGVGIGINNTISNYNGIALGSGNNVSGISAFATGDKNTVTANFSFAGGTKSEAKGTGSFAFGLGENKAHGYNSIAMGYGNQATGTGSICIGSNLTNATGNKIVIGMSNYDDSNNIFEVGKGSKSNAFEVRKDGRAKVAAAPTEENDIVRLKELNAVSNLLIYATNEDIKSVIWG